MSNESAKVFKRQEEEEKLVQYYRDIISRQYEITTEAQKAFMMQLLNTKITQIEPKTDRTKWIHFLLRIGVLGFSAISTILLGLKGNRPGWDAQLSNVVLILTATVTFMSALASFWDIENYWIRLKIMLNRLKTLRYEFVFMVMENKELSNQSLKEFLDRFVATQEDEYWDQYYKHLNK